MGLLEVIEGWERGKGREGEWGDPEGLQGLECLEISGAALS